MHSEFNIDLADEQATLAFGERLGRVIGRPAVVFLRGDLGAGKTTLTRGALRGLGHTGSVKSPTYTLVEPYEVPEGAIYHCDLYRLGDPEELDYLGFRDYLATPAQLWIEWPDRGVGFLPEPDLEVAIALAGEGRRVDVRSLNSRANLWLSHLQ